MVIQRLPKAFADRLTQNHLRSDQARGTGTAAEMLVQRHRHQRLVAVGSGKRRFEIRGNHRPRQRDVDQVVTPYTEHASVVPVSHVASAYHREHGVYGSLMGSLSIWPDIANII